MLEFPSHLAYLEIGQFHNFLRCFLFKCLTPIKALENNTKHIHTPKYTGVSKHSKTTLKHYFEHSSGSQRVLGAQSLWSYLSLTGFVKTKNIKTPWFTISKNVWSLTINIIYDFCHFETTDMSFWITIYIKLKKNKSSNLDVNSLIKMITTQRSRENLNFLKMLHLVKV